MANPSRTVFDCETGKETIEKFTNAETSEMEKTASEAEAHREALKAAELAKVQMLADAIAKLSALGLTPDEIAALRG